MSVSTNPSVVSVDGFVDISFDFTTPNRYTEVWIVHTIDPDKTNFIRLVDGPLFTYNEYVEGYRSLCICPRDYGLLLYYTRLYIVVDMEKNLWGFSPLPIFTHPEWTHRSMVFIQDVCREK